MGKIERQKRKNAKANNESLRITHTLGNGQSPAYYGEVFAREAGLLYGKGRKVNGGKFTPRYANTKLPSFRECIGK